MRNGLSRSIFIVLIILTAWTTFGMASDSSSSPSVRITITPSPWLDAERNQIREFQVGQQIQLNWTITGDVPAETIRLAGGCEGNDGELAWTVFPASLPTEGQLRVQIPAHAARSAGFRFRMTFKDAQGQAYQTFSPVLRVVEPSPAPAAGPPANTEQRSAETPHADTSDVDLLEAAGAMDAPKQPHASAQDVVPRSPEVARQINGQDDSVSEFLQPVSVERYEKKPREMPPGRFSPPIAAAISAGEKKSAPESKDDASRDSAISVAVPAAKEPSDSSPAPATTRPQPQPETASIRIAPLPAGSGTVPAQESDTAETVDRPEPAARVAANVPVRVVEEQGRVFLRSTGTRAMPVGRSRGEPVVNRTVRPQPATTAAPTTVGTSEPEEESDAAVSVGDAFDIPEIPLIPTDSKPEAPEPMAASPAEPKTEVAWQAPASDPQETSSSESDAGETPVTTPDLSSTTDFPAETPAPRCEVAWEQTPLSDALVESSDEMALSGSLEPPLSPCPAVEQELAEQTNEISRTEPDGKPAAPAEQREANEQETVEIKHVWKPKLSEELELDDFAAQLSPALSAALGDTPDETPSRTGSKSDAQVVSIAPVQTSESEPTAPPAPTEPKESPQVAPVSSSPVVAPQATVVEVEEESPEVVAPVVGGRPSLEVPAPAPRDALPLAPAMESSAAAPRPRMANSAAMADDGRIESQPSVVPASPPAPVEPTMAAKPLVEPKTAAEINAQLAQALAAQSPTSRPRQPHRLAESTPAPAKQNPARPDQIAPARKNSSIEAEGVSASVDVDSTSEALQNGWPAKGQRLHAGISRILAWAPPEASQYLTTELQFSADGTKWRTVATDIRPGRAVMWTVPTVTSQTCRLRVVGYNAGGKSTVLARGATFVVSLGDWQSIDLPAEGE